MSGIGQFFIDFGNAAWGTPLAVLLMGGGLYFLFYSRLIPIRHFGHAIKVLLGRYDNPDEPGQISHYQAVSTALAATVGMGNVSGVAVAITTGGPGAIFWMWISALIGVSTKFFTCSLAVMYRGKDSEGKLQGGPMYVILHGLGKNWKFLAIFFCLMGMIGVTPIFQANQITQAIRDIIFIPNGIKASFMTDLGTGLFFSFLVILVVFGGIKRIGKVAGFLVPLMVVLYIITVLFIIFSNADQIIPSFQLIFKDAFTGEAVLGGALGSIIIIGIRRAAFSNEAGIGTAPMAHGAAKTSEPIREGLVAMVEPIIDTVIVCTMTALAIIITGVWLKSDADGITLTANAFNQGLGGFGQYILMACITIFSLTTMFAFPYYGAKCFSFIFGAKYKVIYYIFYIIIIPVGAVSTLRVVIGLIDGTYALMAIPTIISAVILSPKVIRASKDYFTRLKNKKFTQS